MTGPRPYLLPNRQDAAGIRLGALAALFDGSTFRHTDALGIGPGWRCWEVLANRIRTGFRQLLADRGVDLEWGRRLPRLLREAGLADVGADAYFPIAMPACVELELATIEIIRDQLIEGGIATSVEIDRHLSNVAARSLDLAQPPMVSGWGRRP